MRISNTRWAALAQSLLVDVDVNRLWYACDWGLVMRTAADRWVSVEDRVTTLDLVRTFRFPRGAKGNRCLRRDEGGLNMNVSRWLGDNSVDWSNQTSRDLVRGLASVMAGSLPGTSVDSSSGVVSGTGDAGTLDRRQGMGRELRGNVTTGKRCGIGDRRCGALAMLLWDLSPAWRVPDVAEYVKNLDMEDVWIPLRRCVPYRCRSGVRGSRCDVAASWVSRWACSVSCEQ